MSEERNLSVSMRPAQFDEYLGNHKVIQDIRSRLDSNRVPTAFLFSGPKGSGKTTLARCISTCLEGELIEANAADDTGVDAARQLGEQAAYRPLTGKFKVIVLDEAQQLTKQAQYALLKHVEDAPPSTIWIFCTTEPAKIVPTLRDRCVSYSLSGLAPDQIALLVYRGLQHLGKKGDEKTEEFIKTLVREGVNAPRSILMALESFLGGMDPLASIYSSADSPGAFAIAQAVAKKDWPSVRAALSLAQSDEATAIRIVVVNYLKSMLLKGSSDSYRLDLRNNNQSIFASEAILELTKTVPAIEPLGLAELSARLYNICVRN